MDRRKIKLCVYRDILYDEQQELSAGMTFPKESKTSRT